MADKHRLAELITLAVIALAVIGALLFAIHSKGGDVAIGGLIGLLPVVVNSIRGISQSRAMQAMTEQLGQSAPALPPVEIPAPEFGRRE